ncbi:hypothetical protein [Luteimonas aestuarii]|uniref:HzsA-related protein n=1 Tax=Luteimonas aestuarii TaxID=453837 RepID=UPI0014050F64|nr:hypothetical protein [Luteimonas aestuarii]
MTLLSRGSFRIGCLLALSAALVSTTGCDLTLDTSTSTATSKSVASDGDNDDTGANTGRPVMASATAKSTTVQNPILFVTQVPVAAGDPFGSRLSTFANHIPDLGAVPRGGDLMIRYPDGVLRNLTREAGFGVDGLQGGDAIAVREPTVHWDGNKAIFSMLVGGAPARYQSPNARWQMYEVTGLARGQTARITKVPHQPTAYNNVSPLYASDDRILFTSDRPRNGATHLHPQLDEYESTPTITGIYSLDPATGALAILNHAPSGAFSPTIDSYGRVIFTRWDHLQRDQQGYSAFGAVDLASEASNAAKLSMQPETFPESRTGMSSPYGQVNGHTFNLFTPWQMNQDGTDEVTLNHIGRQELSYMYVPRTFASDSALADAGNTSMFANRKHIRPDSGLFHLREDPRAPGTYFGIYAREFAEGTTNQIVRFNGAPNVNPEQMAIVDASPESSDGGRFRNPLPTTSGAMVAGYVSTSSFGAGSSIRLHALGTNASGLYTSGTALTPGISKSVSWWDPNNQRSYSGLLWELEPVEVVARPRPPSPTLALPSVERAVLTEEQVDENALRLWMKNNNLALIIVRNQTSRDRGDRQQPFNLQVPGGVRTVNGNGRVYDVAHFQVFQGNLVRAYDNYNRGRRVIAQPSIVPSNPAYPAGPAGSVAIASDGSSAAFVPANRALTWQITDPAGHAVVRERLWVTMQPGEIRTCTGCHGENSRNQAGQTASAAKPQALRTLLRHWKQGGSAPLRQNSAQPLLPPGAAAASAVTAGAQAQPVAATLTPGMVTGARAQVRSQQVPVRAPLPFDGSRRTEALR